jgi:hypothetical protein
MKFTLFDGMCQLRLEDDDLKMKLYYWVHLTIFPLWLDWKVRILKERSGDGGGQRKQVTREKATHDDNNYVDHANEYQNVFRFLERRDDSGND